LVRFYQNLGKIESKFGKNWIEIWEKWLDLGKFQKAKSKSCIPKNNNVNPDLLWLYTSDLLWLYTRVQYNAVTYVYIH